MFVQAALIEFNGNMDVFMLVQRGLTVTVQPARGGHTLRDLRDPLYPPNSWVFASMLAAGLAGVTTISAQNVPLSTACTTFLNHVGDFLDKPILLSLVRLYVQPFLAYIVDTVLVSASCTLFSLPSYFLTDL